MQRSQSWGKTKFSDAERRIKKSGSNHELHSREYSNKTNSPSPPISRNYSIRTPLKNNTTTSRAPPITTRSPSIPRLSPPSTLPTPTTTTLPSIAAIYDSGDSVDSLHESSNSNDNNPHSQFYYYKTTLKEELDELLEIAIWLDRGIRSQMEQETENMRTDIKQCINIIHERDRVINELARENELLRSQLNRTQNDKDTMKQNLHFEREFSQIMLRLDEEYMDDEELEFEMANNITRR